MAAFGFGKDFKFPRTTAQAFSLSDKKSRKITSRTRAYQGSAQGAAPKKRKQNAKQSPKPRYQTPSNLRLIPAPYDVQAFKGFSHNLAGRATFRLASFAGGIKLRDESSTFRARFGKANVLEMLQRQVTNAVARANLIRENVKPARSWQIVCTIKVTYSGSPFPVILVGYSNNMPLTRRVTSDVFLRAYGHALSQSYASPLQIEILGFGMNVWFAGSAQQALTVFHLNKRPVPRFYDENGNVNDRSYQIQKEQRKVNAIVLKTRWGF